MVALAFPGQDAISGLSPSPDWPEALAEKGATLLASTGYAYGDTVLTEYGERLFVNVSPAAADGNRPRAESGWQRRGQARIPEHARRSRRHRREDLAGDDPVRPAHAAREHAGPTPHQLALQLDRQFCANRDGRAGSGAAACNRTGRVRLDRYNRCPHDHSAERAAHQFERQ